jgi:hypothetical protein
LVLYQTDTMTTMDGVPVTVGIARYSPAPWVLAFLGLYLEIVVVQLEERTDPPQAPQGVQLIGYACSRGLLLLGLI